MKQQVTPWTNQMFPEQREHIQHLARGEGWHAYLLTSLGKVTCGRIQSREAWPGKSSADCSVLGLTDPDSWEEGISNLNVPSRRS